MNWRRFIISYSFVRFKPLSNILGPSHSNAVNFTPDGGKVWIDGGRDEDGFVVIKVVDTGNGIANEEVPKVVIPLPRSTTI